MSVFIWMKGALEPSEIDMEFLDVVNAFNMAGAQGKTFAIFEHPDGTHGGYNIPNITKIVEVGD